MYLLKDLYTQIKINLQFLSKIEWNLILLGFVELNKLIYSYFLNIICFLTYCREILAVRLVFFEKV